MNGVKGVEKRKADIEEIRRTEMKELLKRVMINIIIKEREPAKMKGVNNS